MSLKNGVPLTSRLQISRHKPNIPVTSFHDQSRSVKLSHFNRHSPDTSTLIGRYDVSQDECNSQNPPGELERQETKGEMKVQPADGDVLLYTSLLFWMTGRLSSLPQVLTQSTFSSRPLAPSLVLLALDGHAFSICYTLAVRRPATANSRIDSS